MAEISTKTRKALPGDKFALPAQRKYPIHDAAHVRNAAARLEQEHKAGNIGGADYAKARRAIARAAKRFGVSSEYNKPAKKKQLHVRADIAEGGSLHVRHMRAAGELAGESDEVLMTWATPCALLTAAAAGEDGKPVWIQLAKPGTFRGHPAGPFELNERVFSEIVRNFKATENHHIPIDYEHASEADATDGSIPVSGAPAQGWIVDMKILSGSLWGLVEWLPQARDQIRAGQYKFFSPAIRFNARDRVTGQPIGARMTSGALTNNPFLDGMRPLAAKDAGGAGIPVAAKDSPLAHKPHEYMPQIKRALNMHELSTATECSDQLDRLRDHFDAAGQNPDATHEGIKLGDYCMSLRNVVGAAPGATWDEVFDAVEDLIDAAMDQHVIEDHGGVAETEMTDDDEEEETAMADKETAVQLSEANVQLAESKLKITTLETELGTAKAENVQLKEWKAKREEADLKARVDEAFETYKDKRGLTDASKESMLIVLKAKPEAFEADYPKVSPSQQHLLRNLTQTADGKTPERAPNGAGGARVITLRDLSRQIARDRKISLSEAQRIASRLLNSRKAG